MKISAIKVALFLGLIIIMTNKKKTRGIRNNNPLNIRVGNDDWQGATGDDGAFVQFESPEMGIRAAARILKNYRTKYGLNSVAEIITRWSPPSENDTTSYIDNVAAKVGIARNGFLLESDYPALIAAMIQHENGQQPYSESTIESGFQMGFYA